MEADKATVVSSASVFKSNKIFCRYFDPEKMFLDTEVILLFWGDLTDVPAKNKTLAVSKFSKDHFFTWILHATGG